MWKNCKKWLSVLTIRQVKVIWVIVWTPKSKHVWNSASKFIFFPYYFISASFLPRLKCEISNQRLKCQEQILCHAVIFSAMFGWITLLRITEVNRLKNHFLYCETTQINFHWRRFTQEKTNLCCVNILGYIVWLKLVLGDFPRSLLKSLHIAVLLKLVNLEFASSLWKNLHTVVLPKLVN